MSESNESGAGGQTKRGPAIDLKGMTAVQLRQLIAEAEAELVGKQEAAKADLRAKWQAEAAEAGLTLDAVTSAMTGKEKNKGRKPAAGAIPVKYRGPNGEEWSGRGRTPKWVQTIEAEGRKRDDFAV